MSQGPADGPEPAGGPRCSVLAAGVGEPPEGTAPEARVWLVVAHPGPWGRQATEVLPSELREAADRVAGLRLGTVRRVGGSIAGLPAAMLAGTLPGRVWRRDLTATELEALPALLADPAGAEALARGEEPRLGGAVEAPLVLVCTHGRRDACCAQYGREAARAVEGAITLASDVELRRHRAVDVLESSHLGGHRFAPTAVVLPWGMVYGGLGPDPAPLARAVVDLLADRTVLDGYRGRSTYPQAAQAAEAAARRHLAVAGINAGPDDVLVDSVAPLAEAEDSGPEPGTGGEPAAPVLESWLVRLRHTGGRTFRVVVRRLRTGAERPTSCGDGPTPVDLWTAAVDADAAPGVYLPAL